MISPKATAQNFTERLGVNAIAGYAASHSQIWRETPHTDVGIDGQLEYVSSDGAVTGNVIAVQVKSGVSYFDRKTSHGWRHPINSKHRKYWESFPVPVLLLMHNPEDNYTYWIDVRQKMRNSAEELSSVEIPRRNRLDCTLPVKLFETSGASDLKFLTSIDDVLDHMIQTVSSEVSNCLSFFDLFSHGLTNICRSLYFGTDLAMTVLEYNYANRFPNLQFIPGPPLDFLHEFASYLIAQNLAFIDWSDFMIDWEDRQMLPTFISPLTTRGRQLVSKIHEREKTLIEDGAMVSQGNLHVAQEAIVELNRLSYFRRIPMIAEFQKVVSKDIAR